MQTHPIVIVVDDDAEIWEILEEMLSLHHYTVVPVTTRQEAEEILQHLGAVSIGLVICDVHWTDDIEVLEGYELCKDWQEAHPLLPFVLMSDDLSMKGLPAVRTGKVHFVSKPFAAEEFLATIRWILPV